jgi:hypothetical protein
MSCRVVRYVPRKIVLCARMVKIRYHATAANNIIASCVLDSMVRYVQYKVPNNLSSILIFS